MADTFSIEETNKIRIALGLKSLPVPGAPAGPVFKESQDSDSSSDESEPGSTLESRQAAGYDNWKKLQDEKDAKQRREAKNAAIKRARDLAKRDATLEGKGLADMEEGNLDTKTWLMQQKKRQKKLERERARKLEEELTEREKVAEYTEKDLAGVRVAHEVGDFGEGNQILVLKDTTIDENDEDGDELENLDLKDQERLKERLDVKKRRPTYNPNDDDGTDGRSILAHYDEEIDGKKRKRFTLDGQGATTEEREAKRPDGSVKLQATPVSLDILNDATTSDYLDPSEIKIKKPKKNKKAKSTRQKAIDEDDIFPVIESMPSRENADVDMSNESSKPSKPKTEENSFVDDDDLQASLARQRRAALKKRKKIRPEDIAKQLREEVSAPPNAMDVDPSDDGENGEPGLVIDETSEFVANLQRPAVPEKRNPSVKPSIEEDAMSSEDAIDADVDIKMSYNDVEDEEELQDSVQRASSVSQTPDLTATGLNDESTLNQGVGAAFNLLRSRGLVKTAEDGDINALHRDRQRFLLEKQRLEAEAERRARVQRERDRASGKLDRMSAREREQHAQWENKTRDQQDARQMAEIFNKEYKPDVQLKYIDEFGRWMNQKEAFKALSHQFHGKGRGKQKTEKHLKKIEEEKKREAQSNLDSSQRTGMDNAQGAMVKKNRQAGVRLG